MSPEHNFEIHLSNDPRNDWRGAQTLDTFGQAPNGEPLIALQQTVGGKGRVVFNPLLMEGAGLSMADIRTAMDKANVANRLRSPFDPARFVSKPTSFQEDNLGRSTSMVFDGFMEQGFSSRVWFSDPGAFQNQTWMGDSAPFAQLPKARAFFTFLKDNLPRAIAHFPQELGVVGDKLRQAGLPIPASSVPVLPLEEVVARYEARQATPDAQPTLNQGPRGPKV